MAKFGMLRRIGFCGAAPSYSMKIFYVHGDMEISSILLTGRKNSFRQMAGKRQRWADVLLKRISDTISDSCTSTFHFTY